MLFWSPGKSGSKLHPGDNGKADFISTQYVDLPTIPVRTNNVRGLMAGVSLCDQIVTSDGGALYVTAGVRRPVVALFGNKAAWLWTPWGASYETLQGKDHDARNINVDDVFTRFMSLQEQVRKNMAMDGA